MPGKGPLTEASQELVSIHLLESCAPFRSKEEPLSLQRLAQKLKDINQEKLVAAKDHASRLVSRVVQLEDKVQEAEELRQSMEVAGQRQRHLLPARTPESDRLEFGLGYRPARRLSGDFYDFVALPGGKLGMFVGDVSGHGIEAAILMGVAKKLIHIRLKDTADPAQALVLANADLYTDLDRQTFVSAFVAVFDPEARALFYARAGHTPALLHNPRRRPSFLRLEPPGMVLGSDPGGRFEPALRRASLSLQGGDLVFLYTDGLSEAKNSVEDEFGIERICEGMRLHYERAPQDLVEESYRALDEFSRGPSPEDDVTVLAFKFLGDAHS